MLTTVDRFLAMAAIVSARHSIDSAECSRQFSPWLRMFLSHILSYTNASRKDRQWIFFVENFAYIASNVRTQEVDEHIVCCATTIATTITVPLFMSDAKFRRRKGLLLIEAASNHAGSQVLQSKIRHGLHKRCHILGLQLST